MVGQRLTPACQIAGTSARYLPALDWTEAGNVSTDRRQTAQRPVPADKLTPEERQRVLDICHQPEYASLPPGQIVPILADQGTYIASESSFYRVLHDTDEQHHRGWRRKPHSFNPPQDFCATGANQVWSWDITWLPSQIRGMFFYPELHSEYRFRLEHFY
jgi:hypothetical protein